MIRPGSANEVWSVDCVLERIASGRAIKCLSITDDATHEAIAVVPEHAIGGDHLIRILSGPSVRDTRQTLDHSDGRRQGIHGAGHADLAHRYGIKLRLIQPGKPNENAYIESFNGQLRDECLNEHWFVSLNHAGTVIRQWVREPKQERPKKALGGLTPAAYDKQLTHTAVSSTSGLYFKTLIRQR